MQEVYLGCLVGGIIFAVITILFGDIIDNILDSFDFVDTTVIVTGITIFGGTGILLNTYTSWKTIFVLLLTIIITMLLSTLLFFLYIKPMKSCENSIAFSTKDFIGKVGEVTVPISRKGFGEIILKIGAGNTNQIAASYDEEEYSTGSKVIVTKVNAGTLYVSRYQEEDQSTIN